MDIQLREARVEEARVLTELIMRAKQSNGYDENFMAACVEELTVSPEQITQGDFWVAVAERELCGCARLDVDGSDNGAEVASFFIEPSYQRQGIGRLLWEKLRQRAQEQRVHTVYLVADPNAVPFYRAMGFVEVGQAPSGSIPGRFLPKLSLRL